MSALSNRQKRDLSQLCERAFKREAAIARGRNAEFIPPDAAPDLQTMLTMLALEGSAKSLEKYRHEQVAAACGKAGLRACTQLDYKRVEAHFLDLLGEAGKALNSHMRAESEPRRQAEAVLVQELKRFNLPIGYVAAICRNQYKCSLDDATAPQIMRLVYTVRNRGASRKRKEVHA